MNVNVILVFEKGKAYHYGHGGAVLSIKLEWIVQLHQMDVLISMNVLKEVTIVTPMQLVIIKEAHFIANVTLVSKAVGLTVMTLTNAPKRTL